MAVEETIHFFRLNVGYSVGVRMFPGDNDGVVLNPTQRPYVEVQDSKLKYFKQANKDILLRGLLVQGEEPVFDWETANALTDDDIQALLKSPLKLKKALPDISSEPILHKMLEAAKEKGSANSVIKQIQDRLEEVAPSPDAITLEDMKGVS